jgi:hypothetical protein
MGFMVSGGSEKRCNSVAFGVCLKKVDWDGGKTRQPTLWPAV